MHCHGYSKKKLQHTKTFSPDEKHPSVRAMTGQFLISFGQQWTLFLFISVRTWLWDVTNRLSGNGRGKSSNSLISSPISDRTYPRVTRFST